MKNFFKENPGSPFLLTAFNLHFEASKRIFEFMSFRILMLCIRFPYPPKDGGTIAMFNMISAFHDAGHDVTVFAMNTPKHYTHVRNLPENIRSMAEFYAIDIDTTPRATDALANMLFSRKSYHAQRFDSKGFRKSLVEILKEKEFDFIQLETLYMASYVNTIHELQPKAKVILRAHNVEHEIWRRKASNEDAPWRKIFFEITTERLEKYEKGIMGSEKIDAIVPVTDRDRDAIKKYGIKASIETCHIGMNLDRLEEALEKAKQNKINPEKNSLFYIGALDWLPNQEGLDWFLDKVWPSIHKNYPEVKFYVAGRRMPDKYFRKSRENVIFVGEVEDAYEFMISKSIMVVPLFTGSGMRVKIVEGMGLGKAIIASKTAIEGINAKHTDHAMIAEDKDAAAFINFASMLIEREGMVRALGNHGTKLVRDEYDNQKIIDKLLNFYQSLKKKGAPKREKDAGKKK